MISIMKSLGIVLWHFPFLGFVLASFVFVFGFIVALIPISPIKELGAGLVAIASFLVNPIRKVIVEGSKDNFLRDQVQERTLLIFYFPFALLFASVLILQIAGLYITVVGAPVAKNLSQALPHLFNPIEKNCLEITVDIQKEKFQKEINKILR